MFVRVLLVLMLLCVSSARVRAQVDPLSYLVPCADLVSEILPADCARLDQRFLDDWRAAVAGDRWAQIDLAELFARPEMTGTLVVRPDLMQACTWSLVVVYAITADASLQDFRRAADICGRLPAGAFPVARARALALASKRGPVPP
jgi:hypothetical protein